MSGPDVDQTAEPGERPRRPYLAELELPLRDWLRENVYRYRSLGFDEDAADSLCLALAPHAAALVAAAERRAAQAEREQAARRIERLFVERVSDCACPDSDKRECGWRAGVDSAAKAARRAS